MIIAHTIFSKGKSLFVFWILDDLANALDQSETLLHRRHVRIHVLQLFGRTYFHLPKPPITPTFWETV